MIKKIYQDKTHSIKILSTTSPFDKMDNLFGINDPTVFAEIYERSVYAYRCVRKRANSISTIPWGIFRNNEEITTSNFVNELLRSINLSKLLRITTADRLISGHAIILIKELNILGLPVSLERLNPIALDKSFSNTGELIKIRQIFKDGSFGAWIPRDRFIYLSEYDITDDEGSVPPMQLAVNMGNAAYNADIYLRAFFENYAVPPVIFTTERTVSQSILNRIKKFWNKTFGTPQGQHQVGFLGSGYKAEIFGYPIKDLALSEIRKEYRRETVSAFGVHGALVGAIDIVNRATYDSIKKDFIEETVIPGDGNRFEEEINESLVRKIDPSLEFKFKPDELLIMQDDLNLETERLTKLHDGGIITTQAAGLRAGLQPSEIGDGIIKKNPNPLGKITGAKHVSTQSDLNLWKKKADRIILTGEPIEFQFKSNTIPDDIQEQIQGHLENAEDQEDVEEIFSEYI